VTYFGIKKIFYEKSAELWSYAVNWCKERETSLFPPPIRGVIKVNWSSFSLSFHYRQ
jgi:hypothetical protein